MLVCPRLGSNQHAHTGTGRRQDDDCFDQLALAPKPSQTPRRRRFIDSGALSEMAVAAYCLAVLRYSASIAAFRLGVKYRGALEDARRSRTREGVRSCLHPCPGGCFGDPTHECTCSMYAISRCQKRISGLLPNRIDIHAGAPQTGQGILSDDWATNGRRSSLSKEQRWPMCSVIQLCEAHVSGLTRREDKDVFTGAPDGH